MTSRTLSHTPEFVEANYAGTALRLHSRDSLWTLRPPCVAVNGDAHDMAQAWDKRWDQYLGQWYGIFAVLLLGSTSIAALILRIIGLDRIPLPGFLAALAFVVLTTSCVRFIKRPIFEVDGVEIPEDLFDELTEAQRDALLAARDRGQRSEQAMVNTLMARHKAKSQALIEKQQARKEADRRKAAKDAAALLAHHEKQAEQAEPQE